MLRSWECFSLLRCAVWRVTISRDLANGTLSLGHSMRVCPDNPTDQRGDQSLQRCENDPLHSSGFLFHELAKEPPTYSEHTAR